MPIGQQDGDERIWRVRGLAFNLDSSVALAASSTSSDPVGPVLCVGLLSVRRMGWTGAEIDRDSTRSETRRPDYCRRSHGEALLRFVKGLALFSLARYILVTIDAVLSLTSKLSKSGRAL
jgi:hypothetical protein